MNSTRIISGSIKLAFVAAAAICFAPFGVALAQNSEADSEIALEEIIVTARFREENVRDIGQSIALINGDDLVRQNISEFADIARRIPGVDVSTQGRGRTTPRIRGVSNVDSPTDNLSKPGLVSTTINDVPVTVIGFNQASVHSFDLNRVEILKGPQGALFGEGAAGGVIRYFTKKPQFDAFDGSAKVGIYNISDGGMGYTADLAMNIPITETFALRASAYVVEDDGFIDNVLLNIDDYNDTSVIGGRLQARFQPSDALDVTAFVFFEDQERGADDIVNGDSFVTGPVGAVNDLLDNRPATAPGKDQQLVAGLNVSYDFGNTTVQSITGYFDREFINEQYDSNITALVPFFSTIFFGQTVVGNNFIDQSHNTENFSQEFRLISDFDGRFNYILGAFYRSGEFRNLASFIVEEFAPINGGSSRWILTDEIIELEQVSVFFDLAYDLTDTLSISGGGRFHREDIDISIIDNFVFFGVVPPPDLAKQDVSTFLPRVNVEWRVADNALLYANYSEGIRNGGANSPLIIATSGFPPAQQVQNLLYDNDRVRQLEFGAKTEWMDGDLVLDVAAYFSEFEEIQVLLTTPLGLPFFENGPDAEIIGVEASITIALNENISVLFAGNYVESELANDLTIVGLTFLKGERLPFVSPYSLSTSVDWSFPFRNGVIDGAISYSYLDDFLYNVDFQDDFLPGSDSLDLRLGWSGEKFGVHLFGKNLTDDRSLTTTQPGVSGVFGFVRPPRVIGLEFSAYFDGS